MAEIEQVGGGAGMQRAGAASAGLAGGGPTQKALAMAGAMRGRLMAMHPGKRTWLIAFGVFLAAMCAGVIWFAGRPDWRVLFSGLDGKDVQQVSQELSAAGIPYETTVDGSGIQVPAEMLDKARMEVATKGMPQTGRLGFELFDKPNWVGSEFDERVNYQRALEGELEHTINTLSEVESARVHLVMPHDSLYTSQQRDAKASVVLKLRRRSVSDEQADAIRNLVASAVDDLHPENVALVDAAGRLQLGKRSAGADAEAHEQELAAKLVETLEPVAGVGNVRASVNVDYDSSTADEVDETFDPNNVV